jgi:hypothetical protein
MLVKQLLQARFLNEHAMLRVLRLLQFGECSGCVHVPNEIGKSFLLDRAAFARMALEKIIENYLQKESTAFQLCDRIDDASGILGS